MFRIFNKWITSTTLIAAEFLYYSITRTFLFSWIWRTNSCKDKSFVLLMCCCLRKLLLHQVVVIVRILAPWVWFISILLRNVWTSISFSLVSFQLLLWIWTTWYSSAISVWSRMTKLKTQISIRSVHIFIRGWWSIVSASFAWT